MDENGVAAFGKKGIQNLSAEKIPFTNMLTGGDKATEHLGILNISKGGNYKISYDAEEFNDAGIRGFRTPAALILRRTWWLCRFTFTFSALYWDFFSCR